MEYANENDLPGCILLLDIEKAFDSVKHEVCIRFLNILILVLNLLIGLELFTQIELVM